MDGQEKKEIEKIYEDVKKGRVPTFEEVKAICTFVKISLYKEKNVLRLKTPVVVVGDIHGQFSDLLRIMELGGNPNPQKYVFLGDFVDRGKKSLETIILLFCMKIIEPDFIFFIRGNHESIRTTQMYGFFEECLSKSGNIAIWSEICDVFIYFPICAIIDECFFLVHAGIPNYPLEIAQIEKIMRFSEIPVSGIFSDLLWSDPTEEQNSFHQKNPRGAGCLFNEKNVENFLKLNGLKCIVRSHQLVMDGFKLSFGGKLITVWSAPNYCYTCKNKAAILLLSPKRKKKFLVFEFIEN